jgi:hypothetical protein
MRAPHVAVPAPHVAMHAPQATVRTSTKPSAPQPL